LKPETHQQMWGYDQQWAGQLYR